MRIALDAMGADAAPEVEIEGAVAASLEASHEIILVGDEAVLRPRLDAYSKKGNLRIVHASERIGMHESPVLAVRGKKYSSLLVAMRLVKNGEADAIVSAGNTGAVMVAARTVIGPIRGVARSAICVTMNFGGKPITLLDMGALSQPKPENLAQQGVMGAAFAKAAFGLAEPRVGLLNIGEEEAKGTQVSKEVHRALTAASHVNFVGNVEPKAMYNGAADVVVCDGFIGNVILKTSEAVAGVMGKLMKEKLTSSSMNKLGAVLARSALQDIKETVDPNYHPGAPLLGINGIVIITHGSCTSLGIKNALLGAAIAFENRLNDHIRENIEALRGVEERIGPPPSEEAAS